MCCQEQITLQICYCCLFHAYTELTVFEATKARQGDKRKRQRNDDAGDIEGYLGPWGKYIDEKTTMKPDEEEQQVNY